MGRSHLQGSAGQPVHLVQLADGNQVDGAGIHRVSQPLNYFSSVLNYHKDPHTWEEELTGTATATLMDNEPSVLINCPAVNDEAIIQSIYWPYQAGNAQLAEITGLLNNQTDMISSMGYDDGENGIRFINREDGEDYIELLSFVSGEQNIRRACRTKEVIKNLPDFASEVWNIDSFLPKPRNQNPSDIVMSSEFAQIFVIDLLYLALGRVRAQFQFNGVNYSAHHFINDNRFKSPYMSRASLPIRYYLKNVGRTTGDRTMKKICSTVKSEGGSQIYGVPQVYKSGAISIPSGGSRFISISPSALFEGRPNRAIVIPLDFELLVYGNTPVEWDFIHDGTLTGASFQPITTGGETPSCCEYDISATAISGGHYHNGGWGTGDVKGGLTGGGGDVTTDRFAYVSRGINYLTERDLFTFKLSDTAGAGAITVRFKTTWAEVY